MSRNSKKELPYRSLGLDAARGIALILMMATHCLRVAKPLESPALAQWLLRLEPITPTLFFMLAGAGLAYSRIRRQSFRRSYTEWLRPQLLRALLLCGISFVIFSIWHGPQWPASLTSTGVLQTLGLGIALTALLEKPWLTATVAIGSIFFWMGLENIGTFWNGINQGSFPFFPWIPLMLLGHALGTMLWKLPKASQLIWGASLVIVGYTIYQPGWNELFGKWGVGTTKQFFQVSQSGNSYLLLLDLWNHRPTVQSEQRFWAPYPHLTPILLAASIAGIGFLLMIERIKPMVLLPLAQLGRHSLPIYLGSLAALGPILLLPSALRGHTWMWAVATLMLVAIGFLWSGWRDSRASLKTGA